MKYFLQKKFVIEGLYKVVENVINDNEHYLYYYAGTDYWGPIGKVFVSPKIGIITINGKIKYILIRKYFYISNY